MKSSIEIRKSSIVELDTDAIVNAANEDLAAGGGVSGAVFRAAGHERMRRACDAVGPCETGKAVVTPGFALKAGIVIHAVGPVWIDGAHGEPEKLKSAYRNALELARNHNCRSVGFPLISSGAYGYPVKQAWADAVSACLEHLRTHKGDALRIVFAIPNEVVRRAGKEAVRRAGAGALMPAQKEDWKTLPMPGKTASFPLVRPFGGDEADALRRGHVPGAMEDKWFWYMEGSTLFAHRSWTGYCIYKIDFGKDGRHTVTVNRDPEQYGCTDIKEDRETLNKLLDRWAEPSYDPCEEWLSETYDSLKKAGKG